MTYQKKVLISTNGVLLQMILMIAKIILYKMHQGISQLYST